MVSKIIIKGDMRWNVVFKDEERWQCGIYVPENSDRSQIKRMEKHDGPELFYLIEGNITLVLSEDGKKITELPMEKNIVYIVNEWHNAYRPNGMKGISLVIEKTGVKTEFLNL